MTESVSAGLKRPYCLLEGLLIGLTDTHDLTNGAHLGTKLILYTLELLESPACELNNNIISVRNILIK